MNKIRQAFEKFEEATPVRAVKSGLIMIMPILMIGSFALVFEYFPIPQYQTFIKTALSGRLLAFFEFIYNATFGMVSVFLTATISFSYDKRREYNHMYFLAPITSLTCFFIISGVTIDSMAWDALGVKGVFIAILSAIISTKMLLAFLALTNKNKYKFSEDTDVEFNDAVSVIFPTAAVIASVALFNLIVVNVFHVQSVFELMVNGANAIFLPLGRSFLSGFLMVLVSSFLWFFGIHGSDVLESVMENLFTPAIDVNIGLVASGQAPTEIFTKQFFDNFVLMGGCGTAICLLLAVILFSKRRRNRRLSKIAAVPMIFNINELMLFGFPVILNITMLLPFILTPLFSFITTYSAMRLGWVPLTTVEVNWTAPVLISGYIVTGSIAGSVLQLFNMVAGIFIYRPFVKAYDRRCEMAAHKLFSDLVEMKKVSEATVVPVVLTKLADQHGALARSLVLDLKEALAKNELQLFYQPQYDNLGVCIGAESLLRWKHPLYGMIYPPLVIQLARESEILTELEEYVLTHSVEDANLIRTQTGFDQKISVNISSATIQCDEYFALLQKLRADDTAKNGEICLEVTEQTALLSNDGMFERLEQIKEIGYRLAIDDFSMGHTSLTYLQGNYFDTVKLDGSLITEMMNNSRSYDIIKNIISLSRKLGFSVIAEFVETQEQVKMLEDAGCFQYQGYLFSKAISKEEFMQKLLSEKQSA